LTILDSSNHIASHPLISLESDISAVIIQRQSPTFPMVYDASNGFSASERTVARFLTSIVIRTRSTLFLGDDLLIDDHLTFRARLYLAGHDCLLP